MDDTNTQGSQTPNSSKWWYVFNGERKGPYTENEILNLIKSNVIGRKTQVWREGMNNWIDADLSFYKNEFNASPPPLMPEQIDNRYAWALATVPLMVSIILSNIFVNGNMTDGTSNFITLITILLNCIFFFVDKHVLNKAGYNSSTWMWTGLVLIPVYLFIRASKTTKKYGYAITWLVLFVLSLF